MLWYDLAKIIKKICLILIYSHSDWFIDSGEFVWGLYFFPVKDDPASTPPVPSIALSSQSRSWVVPRRTWAHNRRYITVGIRSSLVASDPESWVSFRVRVTIAAWESNLVKWEKLNCWDGVSCLWSLKGLHKQATLSLIRQHLPHPN